MADYLCKPVQTICPQRTHLIFSNRARMTVSTGGHGQTDR